MSGCGSRRIASVANVTTTTTIRTSIPPRSIATIAVARTTKSTSTGRTLLRQAVNYGYQEGFRAGAADREDRWRADYENCFAYQDANFGYDGYYVDQADYNYYFRQGFQRGYEDGYYNRYQYGVYSNGSYSVRVTC